MRANDSLYERLPYTNAHARECMGIFNGEREEGPMGGAERLVSIVRKTPSLL